MYGEVVNIIDTHANFCTHKHMHSDGTIEMLYICRCLDLNDWLKLIEKHEAALIFHVNGDQKLVYMYSYFNLKLKEVLAF